MIGRLYDNGMLEGGYVKRYGRLGYPTMPRLRREAFDAVSFGPGDTTRQERMAISVGRGLFNFLCKAIRAR